MLLSKDEVDTRLASPLNLINQLREATKGSAVRGEAMKLFGIDGGKTIKPELVCMPPSVDELVDGLSSKIKVGQAHEQALDLMLDSMTELKLQLPSISKPEKLANIASEMNKIVNNINESRRQSMIVNDNRTQVLIYAPRMREEDDYEVVAVNE